MHVIGVIATEWDWEFEVLAIVLPRLYNSVGRTFSQSHSQTLILTVLPVYTDYITTNA